MTGWLLTYAGNALWQVPLLFAAAWLSARLLRPAGALAQQRLWVLTLLAEAVLPACPSPLAGWAALFHPYQAQNAAAHISLRQGAATAHTGLLLAPGLAWTLLALYCLLLLSTSVRLIHGLRLTHRLVRSAQPVLLSPEQEVLWHDCCEHFHLCAPLLLEADSLQAPISLGGCRPQILLPSGLLGTLAPEELQAILAHESAHITRRDYAWNLLLRLVTLPIAFHPLLPITLARLAESREIVCDALAAEAVSPSTTPDGLRTGQVRYARSLLHLASAFAERSRSVSVSHVIGIGMFHAHAHTLERRIMSLTTSIPRPTFFRRVSLLVASCALFTLTCASAVALRTAVSPGDPVRVGGGVMAGEVLTKVQPLYPQAAKDAKIQGTVLLQAVIAKDGAIEKLTVLSGPPELQASALEAVRHWTYKPYLLNGEPTEVETTITITYSLGG